MWLWLCETSSDHIRIYSFSILLVLAFCGINRADDIAWNTTIESATSQLVSQLLASVDNTKSPCDDFHGFICAKQKSSTQFSERPNEEEIFQKFIEADNEDILMDSELMLKNFYDSCTNARTVEHLKKTTLYRNTGGWPAIEGATRNRGDLPSWVSVVAAFHDIGVDFFFRHRVEIKSNRRTVELSVNSEVKNSLREKTHAAEQLLKHFGLSPAEARLKALDFAGLEGYRREVLGDPQATGISNSMTYAEFKAKFDSTDWDVYFRRVLGKPLKDSDGIRLQDEQKLEQVFGMLSKTPIIRLLNYVWTDYLADKSTTSCLNLVRTYFEPLYRYIVQRTKIDRRRMASMFSEIGSVYQALLPDSIWIDEIANQKSKLYLGRIIRTTLNGDEKLDSDYSRLKLSKKNFYRNLEKAQKFAASIVEGSIPSTSEVSVSDLYEFFMGPMYNEFLPQPFYFGSIGEAFAEKMIDGGGGLTPGSWRSSDSDEKFTEFEKCVQEQNGNFELTPAIGNNLVRRILAERETYEALRNWISGNVDAVNRIRVLLESLGNNGRDLNLEKLYFFISVYTHCPEGQDFVNTYLRNSRDFAETFRCPNGSRLKPLRVCSVL